MCPCLASSSAESCPFSLVKFNFVVACRVGAVLPPLVVLVPVLQSAPAARATPVARDVDAHRAHPLCSRFEPGGRGWPTVELVFIQADVVVVVAEHNRGAVEVAFEDVRAVLDLDWLELLAAVVRARRERCLSNRLSDAHVR